MRTKNFILSYFELIIFKTLVFNKLNNSKISVMFVLLTTMQFVHKFPELPHAIYE